MHFNINVIYVSIVNIPTLLENRLLTYVIKNFQHRLLTDVGTIDVKSINVNISLRKLMLN